MHTQNFFLVRFYSLSYSWIQSNSNWNNLNRYLYYQQQKIALIYMDKTLLYLKKTFNLIRSLIIKSGSVLIFGVNSFYYKDTRFNSFTLGNINKNIIELVVRKGIFSNHLYTKNKITIPNIFLIFDYDSYKSVIKEIQNLGILIIGVIKDIDSFLGEYPIVSNSLTYFSHYFILNIYSKIILFNKV